MVNNFTDKEILILGIFIGMWIGAVMSTFGIIHTPAAQQSFGRALGDAVLGALVVGAIYAAMHYRAEARRATELPPAADGFGGDDDDR